MKTNKKKLSLSELNRRNLQSLASRDLIGDDGMGGVVLFTHNSKNKGYVVSKLK